ncbi:hypothetical protein LMED105_07845, partial [Limnobacter sp. MED105]
VAGAAKKREPNSSAQSLRIDWSSPRHIPFVRFGP